MVDSDAEAVNADGSVVVGHSANLPNPTVEAFLWTADLGMVNLRAHLLGLGVSGLEGWKVTHAMGVSADGRTIVGHGINPSGLREAWLAFLGDPCYADSIKMRI